MVLRKDGKRLFALGMYELPRDESEWRAWGAAGIDIVCCHTHEQLDMAQRYGMFGWVPLPMILKDGDDGAKLAARVNELKDHPALAVWEAPDEAIWHAGKPEPTVSGKRLWTHPPDVRERVHGQLDALVRGLERGTEVLRKLDPVRPIWLNESGSNTNALARAAAYLDIVGFDGYPIPPRVEKPMAHLGVDTSRFVAMTPNCEHWIVEQAFAWAHLPGQDRPVAYPTREESRFMAWQAIARGATGLLWWGSAYEPRPCPFLGDLMAVVAEIAGLHALLAGGEVVYVRAEPDPRSYPMVALGVRHLARRAGDRTLLLLLNEDAGPADAIVTGIDWIDPRALRPVVGPAADSADGFTAHPGGGWIVPLKGYEVRIYVG